MNITTEKDRGIAEMIAKMSGQAEMLSAQAKKTVADTQARVDAVRAMNT